MQRQHLILLTAGFPYGQSEPFLESEFPYLCGKFKRVSVIAVGPDDLPLRDVPDNVDLYSCQSTGKQSGKLKSLPVAGFHYLSEVLKFFTNYGTRPGRATFNQMLGYWREGQEAQQKLNEVLDKSQYSDQQTVIYSYWLTSQALGAALLKKQRPALKAVARCHGWDLYYERSNTDYLPLRPLLLKTLDGVYPVSGHGAAYLDGKTKFSQSPKIEVRYLGVNRAKSMVRPDNDSQAEFRMISCARMVSLKRIHLIISALSLLSRRSDIPRIEWCHLGGGLLEKELRSQAVKDIVDGGRVKAVFMSDMSNSEVLDFYASHQIDLFVSTSRWEGLPVSMMEAAAYAIPILATNVGGVSEIVQNHRSGKLLGPDPSPVEIAEGILHFCQQPPAEASSLSYGAQALWRSHFDANSNFNDWAKELSE